MRQLLKYGGTISEGIVLERIEFDFDDNGEPELPSMISDRDISKVVRQAPASVGV